MIVADFRLFYLLDTLSSDAKVRSNILLGVDKRILEVDKRVFECKKYNYYNF